MHRCSYGSIYCDSGLFGHLCVSQNRVLMLESYRLVKNKTIRANSSFVSKYVHYNGNTPVEKHSECDFIHHVSAFHGLILIGLMNVQRCGPASANLIYH